MNTTRLMTRLACWMLAFGVLASGLAVGAGRALPDGAALAVIYQRRLHLLDIDRHLLLPFPRLEGEQCCPAWSPDGRHLAFTSGPDAEVYIADAFGAHLRRLTEESAFDGSVSWSPDGRRLFFISFRYGMSNFYTLSVDAPQDVHRFSDHNTGDHTLAVSPDGQQAAFVSFRRERWSIYIMDISGSRVRPLVQTDAISLAPRWSPDGQQLVFVSHADDNQDIYAIHADGSNMRRLTTDPAADYAPAWSPDGQEIVFISDRDGEAEVYIMRSDGSDVRRLTYLQSPSPGITTPLLQPPAP